MSNIRPAKMLLSKKVKTCLTIFCAATSITSCTLTTTKTKNPVFNVTTDQVQNDLNKLVSCESINLDGREINKNGKANSELEIDIINGQNIPGDESQMISLGKLIASDIKRSLKDQKQYNTYNVLFVK